MAETVSTDGRRGVFLPLTPISAQEACQHLGVTPQVLRSLFDEYADFVNLHRRDGRTYLDALSFSRLRLVVYWRTKGLAPDEIRARLSEAQGEHEASRPRAEGVGGEANGGPSVPPAALEELSRRMEEQERRWREERERILTLCMRLQQEVNHLHHKVDEICSRRRRRRLF